MLLEINNLFSLTIRKNPCFRTLIYSLRENRIIALAGEADAENQRCSA
jgi:hypothetical protein